LGRFLGIIATSSPIVGVPVGSSPRRKDLFLKETHMSKNVLVRVLAPRRPDHSRPRPACRLSVEPLEGRLLLSGDMVLRWNSIFLAAARTAGQSGGAPQSRYGAIVQAAVFDAVNSIDQSYT